MRKTQRRRGESHKDFRKRTRVHKTSRKDLPEDLTRIEIDMRHYCRYCKRKRAERHMKIIGTGAFGKKSWACDDNKAVCRQIAELKIQQRAQRHG